MQDFLNLFNCGTLFSRNRFVISCMKLMFYMAQFRKCMPINLTIILKLLYDISYLVGLCTFYLNFQSTRN